MSDLKPTGALPTFESFLGAKAAPTTTNEGVVIGSVEVQARSAASFSTVNPHDLIKLGAEAIRIGKRTTEYGEAIQKMSKDLPKVMEILEKFEKETEGLDLVMHSHDCDLNCNHNNGKATVTAHVMIQMQNHTNAELIEVGKKMMAELKKHCASTASIKESETQYSITLIWLDELL